MSEEVRTPILCCLGELGDGGPDVELLFHQCIFTGTKVHGISIRFSTGLLHHCPIFLIKERRATSQQWAFLSPVFTVVLIAISGLTVLLLF